MNDKARYTKEELSEKVIVPSVVEQDLKRIISERLEQCGLYFRVFSRTKTAASMAKKFEMKDYGEGRKLQDLVGVRINLYFDDDVAICRQLMENTFNLLEWSTSERSDEEFKPTKLNGVFRMPEYLKNEISPETWEMSIDDTFELQIKTMFFEGWHEIEHDMRYKGEELWDHFPGFSRYFNSILATLELCDKSMVTLFEDMGHALYKQGQWTDMIRTHFRLKVEDKEMYPEVEQLLSEDFKESNNSLGKRIYRTTKKELVELLSRRAARKIPVNVNTIVAILNDNILHDSRLSAIFREKDVYNDGREESVAESRHYQLKMLQRHVVFQMVTRVDGSRIKDVPADQELIFGKCASAIYGWVQSRYGGLFHSMPKEVTSYEADLMAYHVMIDYEPKARRIKMHVRHLDMEVGGRVWFSECLLQPEENGELILRVCNGYAEPSRDNTAGENDGLFFSYPGFYKTIVDSVGVCDGLDCYNRRRILKDEDVARVTAAIADKSRHFPVVLIASELNEDGLMNEDWLGAFRVSDFTRTVWRYAHVLTTGSEVGSKVLEKACGKAQTIPGLYIFWPDGEVSAYTAEDVKNCSFGRHLEAHVDARTYDIVYGGQAFYHKIVTDLRDWNVDADMWHGFQLESCAHLP